MASQEDQNDLLNALFEMGQATGKRPSIVDAQLRYLPEWGRDRMLDAAQALLDSGFIVNMVGPVGNVDISSTGRKRVTARANSSQHGATTYNIGSIHNSPIQHISAGAHGVQNVNYQMTTSNLQSIIDIYRQHVGELNLDETHRRRADAAVATIEAQLIDENPDQGIVKSAGKSLRTIVESAIGGAAGNVLSNPATWTLLFSMFS